MSEQSHFKLLSVSEVATELGITRQRVHDLIKNGQIVAHKLGRFYYIEDVEIQRYKDKPVGKPYQPRTTASSTKSIDICK